MRKRARAFAAAMLCAAIFRCFSLEPVSKEIQIDGLRHQISLETLDKDPVHFLLRESVSNPASDIAHFTLTATFSENRTLKTLVVVMLGSRSFIASGELEWLFPAGTRFNLYGTSISQAGKEDMMTQTLSFISGLSDFCTHALPATNGTVTLKVYDRKGMTREFSLPSEFFSLFADIKTADAYR